MHPARFFKMTCFKTTGSKITGFKTTGFKTICCVIAALAFLTPATLAAFAQTSSSNAGPAQTADTNLNDPDRQEAMRVFQEHKLPEAAALWEKVVMKYPRDSVAHEALGTSLLGRADTQADPEKRKADRKRARAELLRAQELGDHSDLSKALLAGIAEDGGDPAFSNDKEVQAAMARGEAAFAKAEWDEAIKQYSRAFELDPRLYLAAVDIGDTYFRLKKIDMAGEWFQKAIQIAPNEEIAYRYWADALMSDGKMKEARAKFIAGLVAFPYAKTSWAGLNGWLTRNHLAYNKISIHVPQGPTTDAKGGTVINVEPGSLGKKDGGEAWLAYSIQRTMWKKEKFAKEFPGEPTYRHSLKEEVDALGLAVTVFTENKKNIKDPDPSLVTLAKLQADGMLESYVLLVRPDNDLARDYAAYLAAHRDKLIQFVDKYVVPLAP
jgi:tetratricopeptide (TPR) repeat protein